MKDFVYFKTRLLPNILENMVLILMYLHNFIIAISQATGMDPHDIAATLQQLEVVQLRNGK